jgi:predicted TIM-barrel fold metal-dependent hydrolase
MVILPVWNKVECVREIHRMAAKGARAISFPDNPAALGLDSYQSGGWDSVFSAAEEADMPLCMHFGSSRVIPYTSPDASLGVVTALFGMTLYNSMAELTFSPTFVKHPNLKIVYAEGGIGWIPYALQRMDQVWEKYRTYTPVGPQVNRDARPSDLVREHMWGCFIDDPVGIDLRHQIGVDRLLWESDYPHQDSLFPNSRSTAKKVFEEVPSEEVRRIVSENASNLFRFPLPVE